MQPAPRPETQAERAAREALDLATLQLAILNAYDEPKAPETLAAIARLSVIVNGPTDDTLTATAGQVRALNARIVQLEDDNAALRSAATAAAVASPAG